MIYRASCAMKAAAVVRVRKVEKSLADFEMAREMIEATENQVIEDFIASFVMNQKADDTVNILIACDKGMCGEFMSHISTYFKKNKHNGQFWLVFGSKLEIACANSEKTVFMGNTFLNQMELFLAVGKIADFVMSNKVHEINFHYFVKDKIVVKEFCSRERVLRALAENADQVKKKNIPVEHAQLLFASYLYQAMLSSMLEENKQRLVAMTQAKTNAEDMGKLIARLYNKARQEKITLELNEITAGII